MQITRLRVAVQVYTDKDFAKMDDQIPSHVDGVSLRDWIAIGRHGKVGMKEERSQFDNDDPKMAPNKGGHS